MPIIGRKKRCVVCRRMFVPHPKIKQRAVTCGDPTCQKERHRRQCARWNQENVAYFRSNYLEQKLEQIQSELSNQSPQLLGAVESNRSTPAVDARVPVAFLNERIKSWWRVVIVYILQAQTRALRKICGRCHADLKDSRPHDLIPTRSDTFSRSVIALGT